MKRVVVALVLALGFACSSSEEAPPGTTPGPDAGADANAPEAPALGSARSGSRLKIVRYQAPGDVYAEPALRDVELGPCTPMQTADDAVRCVPDDRAYVAFGDGACKVPVVVSDGACDVRHVTSLEDAPPSAAACDLHVTKRARVFSVGAEQAAATVYFDDGNGCSATSVPPGGKVFAATELAPSRMVALEKKDEAIGRVAVRVVTSEDGLRLPLGLVDAASGKSCSFYRAGDGQDPLESESTTVACVPGPAAIGMKTKARWADDSCTKPAAGFVDACASAPSYVELRDGSDAPGCAGKKTLHAAGAQLSTVFAGDSTVCGATNIEQDFVQSYWSAGDPLPLASFATVERTVAGSGRLRAVSYVADGKKVLDGFVPRLVDGDDACVPASVDGVMYCLPSAFTIVPDAADPSTRLFADAACTKRVAFSGSECHRKPRFAIVPGPSFGCGAVPIPVVTRMYEIGARPAALYATIDGACQPSDTAPGLDTYELGAEIRPSDVLVRLEAKEL